MATPGEKNTASSNLSNRTGAQENTNVKLNRSDVEGLSVGRNTPNRNSKDGSSQRALPPSTEDVLLNFQREPLNSQQKSGRVVAKRERKVHDEASHKHHSATLAKLRECLKDDPGNLKGLLSLLFRNYGRPPLPSLTDLLGLAWYFYPPRGDLDVQVYDIYSDHAERTEIKMGDIEAYWQQKPEGAVVRWIHAPVGMGIYHSSLEDVFRKVAPMGRSFNAAGMPGFPYLETDCLNLRHREDIEELRDVQCLLSGFADLNPSLDNSCFDGDQNQTLRADLEWRGDHLGTGVRFWDVVASDLPWQCSDEVALRQQGPLSVLRPTMRSRDYQVLSKHPEYLDGQLVRNPFRCFHRMDGLLLTMSAAKGVDFLDKNLVGYIHKPADSLLNIPKASALGYVMSEFLENGTSTPGQWHRESVEWFLVHLITEIGTTPHAIRQGHAQLTVLDIYQEVIRELKQRIFDTWKRNETVKLTRKFLACTGELAAINLVLDKKVTFFRGLKQDCERLENEDEQLDIPVHNPAGQTMVSRVQWALDVIEKEQQDCAFLLSELQQSMQALFQLRSIEQNELAIVADSQNKAILIFTGVTIIFLPLSFCASYFGMNLKGISDTSKTERYFWSVCGSTGVLIIIIIALYAFQHRIAFFLKQRRPAISRSLY